MNTFHSPGSMVDGQAAMRKEILIQKLQGLKFRDKILFSTLAVMFLLSVGIALATRWLLVNNLTSELEIRGLAIAQSLADPSRTYILTKDNPNLVSLVFDAAQLGERKPLIAYIFIADTQQSILAHTFTTPFPNDLRQANPVGPEQNNSIKLIRVHDNPAYDIAVPIREGIYQIGTIHVGLSKKHIDHLIAKLRITFLGIISVIGILFVVIIHWLSRYISRPISQLTLVADEISRGNLDAYMDSHKEFPSVNKRAGNEVAQLTDSFNNMVTSIKLYRTRLQESEEKYRSLFHSGPDPIFVLDRNTFEILDANPSAEKTYGYTKSELLGTPFRELVPEYEEAYLRGSEDKSLDDLSLGISHRAGSRKKGNLLFYVNVHACPTLYKEREAIIVATNDITEIMEKDAQLIQASKMTALGEMSAGVAHELNQPLNAIKMGSEFLNMVISRSGSVPQEHLQQVVNEISSQVDRASEIINTLREFGRKANLIEERVNVNKPIRGVFTLLSQQLSLQNIEVKLELGDALDDILAHNNRLQQVIFNLVTNARDAIHQKRKEGQGDRLISIRSFQEGDRVLITVSDTGMGIPESLKNKIFEPFFTTKEAGQGMGLGLSITYGIVKDYGGKIDVQSQEGAGTTFKLSFPVCSSTREEKKNKNGIDLLPGNETKSKDTTMKEIGPA